MMNLIKFVSINKKRILGTSLLLSLLFAQSAGAAASVSDSIVSKGNIEYDADGNGTADVYFYSKDLSTIATGIDALNVDISTMEVAMTQLSNQTTQYKTDIISGLNRSVYAKANIASTATFEDIIQKINNIPAPSVAKGTYYTGGDNTGLNVGLSDTVTSADVNIDNVTTLNLGINEAITLPSGYYPNDITIQNNVANKGSITSVLTNTNKSITLSPGYYGKTTISSDYNAIGGSVIFHIGHKHVGTVERGGACYSVDTARSWTCGAWLHLDQTSNTNSDGVTNYRMEGTCYKCGTHYNFNHDHSATYQCGYGKTYYYMSCGHEEGEELRTTTDINDVGTTEKLLSAEIIY